MATAASVDPFARLRPAPPTAADELCACDSISEILLQPRMASNPIVCVTCRGEIPPERTRLTPDLVDPIADWLRVYDAFYALWLDSREFEEWAKSHLESPGSPVNIRGIELARRLNKIHPCYLYLFREVGDEDRPKVSACPGCSEPLRAQRWLKSCANCLIALHVTD